jgi:hypothetical protein
VLLAYFSRPGENYYYYGERIDLEVGNTEVLTRMIRDRIDCDVHRMEASDPYPRITTRPSPATPASRTPTLTPAIANALPSIRGYVTVLLASPMWNVRPPMIVKTFTEALDFRGMTVRPVTTRTMSRRGTAARDYADACRGATLAEGLAIQGEQVTEAGADLDSWLRRN